MRDSSAWRGDWATITVEETRLLCALTVQESVRQWLILQHTFDPQLQQSAALFGPERQAALIQLRIGCTVWQIGRHNRVRPRGPGELDQVLNALEFAGRGKT